MNRSSQFPPHSCLVMVCITFLAVMLGCDDGWRFARLPLVIYSIEHPDSLQVGRADTLEVGAMVGYDRCELETGGIEQRGDSLIVRGNALCRYRECRDCPGKGPTSATAPVSPNPQWLRFPLLDLAPGRYFIVANELRDTLVVTSGGVLPQRRFTGLGQLTFACSTFQLRMPWRRFELDLPLPVEPADVELHGTIVGPATCDTVNARGTLHVRSMIFSNNPRAGTAHPGRTS